MTISRRARILSLAALIMVVAASCGGDGDDIPASGGDTTGASATGTSAATGSTDPGDSGDRYGGSGDDQTGSTGEDGGGEGGASVQANNFAFDPSELEVESGDDLTVKNGNANTPHTFTVDDADIDVELAPLASEDVTVDLEPGSYDFVCRFHADMTGTLTVT